MPELGSPVRLTADQLSRRAGMSTRNIRAHQARGLLTAPVRSGRAVYYDESHLRRLKIIQELQQQGYNLAAIAAMLGMRNRPGSDDLAPFLDWLRSHHPALVHTFSQHRIVASRSDGRIGIVRPRALRAALAMDKVGIKTVPSMQLLSDALDHVAAIADKLIADISIPVPVLQPSLSGDVSWADLDQASALRELVANLLIEAFRVAVENRGQDIFPEPVRQRSDGDLTQQITVAVDYG